MRVPVSWLGEFVDLPDEVTHEHIHAALVRVGLEEEDVHGSGIQGPIIVGRVLEFVDEPQSNGKTIRWCQVDVAEAEPRGIVCGANNFKVGDKVVVSLPGSVLPGPFPITARKTYGHVSDGMIASARELGIGEEYDGILRLATLGLDPEVGANALPILGLDDFAVEVNVTPDRGYALSVRGVGREYSHSTGSPFRDPALRESLHAGDAPTGFAVTIDDAAPVRGRVGASVFVTRSVRDLDPTRPTPPWMTSRLALAGIRAISLVVDITNYVMLELGQPIHAYDLDKLSGGITVRRAAAGETLVTLDGQTRVLDPGDLVITDESGPIGLAGVMGGATTQIGATTRNVLIEAANFDPVSVARTVRRHKLPSEASRRFERGVDPAVAAPASARVVELLIEHGGGIPDPLGSVLDTTQPPDAILLEEDYVSTIVGVDYSADEVTDSLAAIGASIQPTEGGLSITPPSWRPDLTDKATLAEEVARIVGYDRIPSVLPTAPPGRGLSRDQRLRRAAAAGMAAAGFTEVLAYPFLPKPIIDRFGDPVAASVPAVKLANPLDAGAAWLRTSLIPGLIDIAQRNLSRGLTDLALFEIGVVYRPIDGEPYGSGPLPPGDSRPSDAVLQGLRAGIPTQPWHASTIVLGDAVARQPGQGAVPAGIADAIESAISIAAAVGARITVRPGRHKAFHPGRTAELWAGGELVGFAGELLPAMAIEADLPRVVGVVELDLDALIRTAPLEVSPTAIATLPAATQDLSLVVDSSVTAGDVLSAVVEGAGALLEDARLVDDYRGPRVPSGSKSLTFALRFRAPDRTLTAAEASAAKHAAVALAGERFGATLRE